MKAWPIITLGALIWGSFSYDGSVGRESTPHSRFRHGEFNPDDFVANMPARVATVAYREFFRHLLSQEDGTEWTVPGASSKTSADAHDLVDDDPGKKLFWHTIWGDTSPVPFPGWGDPNPIPNPQFPVYSPTQFTNCCGDMTGPPILTVAHIVGNDAIHINGVTEGLTGDQIKALDNLNIGAGGSVTLTPCETILVNGICTMPCKPDDPLCKEDDGVPIVLKPSPPVLGGGPVGPAGGGGGGGVGPIGGSGGGAGGFGGGSGAVPEPSTWLMLISGFGLLWVGYRRQTKKGARLASL